MPMNETPCPNCGATYSPEEGKHCPSCGIDTEAAQSAPPRQADKAHSAARVAIKTGGTITDIIGRVCWGGVLLAAIVALFNFASTYATNYGSISAPQLAALAAESIAIAVLPYVLARAWDEICRPPRWR